MTADIAQTKKIITELRALLPAHAVLATNEELRPYECDGLSAYRQVPLVVVLPENVEQVQAVVRLCHRLGVPVVVARGPAALHVASEVQPKASK